MSFCKCIYLQKHHHNQDAEYFHHPQRFSCSSQTTTPVHSQPRQLLTCLQSLQVRFVLSRVSFKWTHIVCPLLCLASLVQHCVFEIHQCCWDTGSLLPFMDREYSILWINHILFIHLPNDELLCCFQCSAICIMLLSKFVCVNLYTDICFQFFSFRHVGVKLLGHMRSVYLSS